MAIVDAKTAQQIIDHINEHHKGTTALPARWDAGTDKAIQLIDVNASTATDGIKFHDDLFTGYGAKNTKAKNALLLNDTTGNLSVGTATIPNFDTHIQRIKDGENAIKYERKLIERTEKNKKLSDTRKAGDIERAENRIQAIEKRLEKQKSDLETLVEKHRDKIENGIEHHNNALEHLTEKHGEIRTRIQDAYDREHELLENRKFRAVEGSEEAKLLDAQIARHEQAHEMRMAEFDTHLENALDVHTKTVEAGEKALRKADKHLSIAAEKGVGEAGKIGEAAKDAAKVGGFISPGLIIKTVQEGSVGGMLTGLSGAVLAGSAVADVVQKATDTTGQSQAGWGKPAAKGAAGLALLAAATSIGRAL